MSKPMTDGNGKPIVLIELSREKAGWKPFNVICQDKKSQSQYDFDWCEKPKTLCYHESGGGPVSGAICIHAFAEPDTIKGKVWCDKSIKLVNDAGAELDDAALKAMGYERVAEWPFNPFDEADCDESTEWCTICESRFPADELCAHVVYNDDGYYDGCGSSETNIADVQRSMFQFLDVLPAEFIEGAIKEMQAKNFHFFRAYGDLQSNVQWRTEIDESQLLAEHEGSGRYSPAIDWLLSLDAESDLANALTMGWFWQHQRAQHGNRCVLGNLTFIVELEEIELARWLAIDPFAVRELPPLAVPRTFEHRSANDLAFIENPKGTTEVLLWPKGPKSFNFGLKLSVARCRVGKDMVELVFGRILERNGVHISKLEGYDLCKFG